MTTNMRIYKSLYPPVPLLPTPNHYDFLLHRPDQEAWPDYTVYINGLTGERMRFSAFKTRVDAAAVAIVAQANRGGLAILPGADERIGVLCENCIVRANSVYLSSAEVDQRYTFRTTLCS